MSLDTDLITPWLVFDITGQWCLLALLITFAVAKHLPQRNNPFLVNFILTSFLATIPPALLLYTGKQFKKESDGLCFVQAALVDGVAPMFGVAQVVLVFDTWFELRSCCLHKPNLARRRITKYALTVAPYLVLWIWTFSSFIAAMQSRASRYDGYVYCVMSSQRSNQLRNLIGWFMAIVGVTELFLELWVCWMMYHYRTTSQKYPHVWRANIHFSSRLLVLSLLQFMAVFLSLINTRINSPYVKFAYDLMDSMNALATFIAFGTQRSVLQTWKFWVTRAPSDSPAELQSTSYPSLEGGDTYSQKLMRFKEEFPEREDKV